LLTTFEGFEGLEINDTKTTTDKTNRRQARRDNNNDYTEYFETWLALQTTYEIAIATADEEYYDTVIAANTNYDTTVTEADKKYDDDYCQLTGQYYDTLLAIDTGGTVDGNFYNNGTSSLNVQVCFPAGTPVILADGTTKNIENILPDDLVKTVDHQKPDGTVIEGRVIRVFQNNLQPLWRLNFGMFEIRATKEHPFYVKGKGWVTAENLQIGDVCRSASDEYVSLIQKDFEPEPIPVFNFEVKEKHTYFVGKSDVESVLVHNECKNWWDNDWTDWINPFSYIASAAYTVKQDIDKKTDLRNELSEQIVNSNLNVQEIINTYKAPDSTVQSITVLAETAIVIESITPGMATSHVGKTAVSSLPKSLSTPQTTKSLSKLVKIDDIVAKIPSTYKANFKCTEFANELVKALKKSGINGKTIELNGGNRGFIVCKSYKSGSVSISETGNHVRVQVGDKVYDNLHSNGIPFDQWIQGFDSPEGIKIINIIEF
jgi:hypothetical protein